jgi:N-acetylmuramoyl-L-alanine amidase
VAAVADRVKRIGVEDGAAGDLVLADAPADLDDRRPLLAVDDLELLSRGGRRGQRVSPSGCGRIGVMVAVMVSRGTGSRIVATLAVCAVAGSALAGASAGAGPTARPAPSPRADHASLPLAGRVVGIDPGHNGRNGTDPGYINHLVWNGREEEGCDTTGTETDGGYTEARFNFNVAEYLAGDLRADGARVVLTRSSNDGLGPCVNERSEIINRAHANVAIDIHADGGPASGRGFTVLEPVADGPNDRVIGPSRTFGNVVRDRFHTLTGMPLSTYDGTNGITDRDNLAGLNLTTVPKVLIECGNMRNSADAALLVRSSFQRLAAHALAEAITTYLLAGG